MKVNRNSAPVAFRGQGEERLQVRPSNMGEPYRDGVEFSFEDEDTIITVFLEVREVVKIRDLLDAYLLNDTTRRT